MAVTTEVGQVDKATGAATATQTITLAAEPDAMLFWWGDTTVNDSRVIMENFGVGITDFTTECSCGMAIENAAATTDTYKRSNNAKGLMYLTNTTGALLAHADVTKASNVVTLSWTTNNAVAYKINYMAFYGSDITNCKVGIVTATTGAGSLSTTDPGFKPSFVLLLSNTMTAAQNNTSVAHAQLSLGWAANRHKQGALTWLNRDNIADVDLYAVQRTDSCLLELTATGTEEKRYSFTSFDSTGFTLNKTTSTTATEIYYLAFQGGDWSTFGFDKDTDTGEELITGLGHTPKAAVFGSVLNAAGTAIVSEDSGMMLGASDGTNNASVYIADDDAAAATVVRGASSATYSLMGGTLASLNAQATVQSFSSDTIDLDWATNTGAADHYIGFSVADTTPIVGTNLTSGTSTTNGTGFSTASITPTADSLVLLTISSATAASARTGAPTVSGNGLTWVRINSDFEYIVSQGGAAYRYVDVFRALGASPSAGAATVTFAEEQECVAWSVDEFSGVDTSGTNGSGAIVQHTTNTASTATSLTVTLAAFGDTDNATFGVFSHNVQEANTPGAGFNELGDVTVGETPLSHVTEWKGINDTSVDASWATSGRVGGLAIEIKAAAGATHATATPAAIAATTTITTPTFSTGSVVTVVLIASTTTIGTPTESTGSTVSPILVAATTAVGAPTVTTGSTVTAVRVNGTTTIGGPTTSTGVSFTPSIVASTTTISAPTVSAGSTVTAVRVDGTTTIGAPTTSTGVTVTPSVIAAVTTIDEPAVSAGGSATVSPSRIDATTTISAPDVSTGAVITAALIAGATTVTAPDVSTGATVTAVLIAAATTIGSPTISTATPSPATYSIDPLALALHGILSYR